MSMARPARMIISGTTRIVVNRRMLPCWFRSQPSFIARLPCESSPAEFDGLDVLPGDVDAASRDRAPEKHSPQIHVVGFHPGSVRQQDGGAGTGVSGGDVGGERVGLDGTAGERRVG